MTYECDVTGKRPQIGHKVSHSNIKTKRRFKPNLHERRFWLESEKRFIKLRVSTKALKTIDKKGIEVVLADLKKKEKERS